MNKPRRAARVCLNMIVRDEAAIIARCLASAAPGIDCCVIVDTGSSDDTLERARALLDERGIPSEFHHAHFVDFGATRNAALDLCRRSALEFDYILLLDADHELLVNDPSFRERLEAPAYHLAQHGSLRYDNVRLVSRDLGARYVGATHEYLDLGASPVRLETLAIRDHADGSSRPEKIERDLRLLRRALKQNPGDARAMFYLAQTLREAGHYAEAARWYQARIRAGGWEEEIWYSRWMLALCSGGSGDEFERLCMDAWNARPWRAEPLHSMARRLRERGDHERAMTFAERGRDIPLPDGDLLFVDEAVYRHGFDEEASICGYYCRDPRRREAGRDACFQLATRREAPALTRVAARNNAVHYARRVDQVFPGRPPRPIELDVAPGWRMTNPSIIRTEDGWAGIVRTVNYRLDRGHYHVDAPDGVIRTRNVLVRFSEDFDIVSAVPVVEPVDAAILPGAPIRGYEDCRLFAWRGGLWCSATVADRCPDITREMLLLELDESGVVRSERPLSGLTPGRHEKNWVPLVFDGELLFLYQSDPTTIVRYDPATGTTSELVSQAPALALEHLRGGSQAVRVEDGWLYLTHEVAFTGDGTRIYLHRFVHLDGDFRVGAASEPFYFARKGVEFAAGLARDGRRLVASFGVGDGEARIAEIDLEQVRAHLGLPPGRSADLARLRTSSRPAGARLTLVTSWFDLDRREPGRPHDTAFYREHGQWLLGLDRDLVVFADPWLAAEVSAKRNAGGLGHRTLVIPVALEGLPAAAELEAIRHARVRNPVRNAHPPKDTALYITLVWSKFFALAEAMRLDPFASSHFAWVDFALAHVADTRWCEADRVFDEPPERARLFTMCPFDTSDFADEAAYFSLLHGHVAAGYLPGSRAVLEPVCEHFDTLSRDCLARGFAPSEEQLLPMLAVEHPELFEAAFGDYPAILANQARVRGTGDNLLFQMRSSRERGDWQQARQMGVRILESIEAGDLEASAGARAELLEETFIAAWHADAPFTDLAERAARAYVSGVDDDAGFRKAFLANERRVRENFAHLQADVFDERQTGRARG